MSFVSEEEIVRQGGSPVTTQVLDPSDHREIWKECCSCFSIQPFKKFRRDASYKEGVRDQCLKCETTPSLSIAENTELHRELNNSNWNVKRQRWEHQDDYRCFDARWGRPMHAFEFIGRIRKLIAPDLIYFMD